MNQFKVLLLAVCSVVLVGCATNNGQPFELRDLMAFKVGSTRYEDVQAQLGVPRQIHRDADGGFRAGWAHSASGVFTSHNKAVIMQFGPDRRLVGIISTAESNSPDACAVTTSNVPRQ